MSANKREEKMENTEQAKGFEVFEIKPQIVAKGKQTTELVRSDLIRANVQVVTDGGETNLHAHTGMDAIWVVLQGAATFYGKGDEVVGRLAKHQGILIPRPNPYWFESSGDEPLVILHVMAYQPGAVAKRIDYTPRKELPRDMEEGKFFGQPDNQG
jgi:mannose-6-phosphate isomerase-like protein (cupin superfamily)